MGASSEDIAIHHGSAECEYATTPPNDVTVEMVGLCLWCCRVAFFGADARTLSVGLLPRGVSAPPAPAPAVVRTDTRLRARNRDN